MVAVRLWTRADIDFVAQSIQREGWGYTRRDVERCWGFEPKGCFIAEVEGRPVGHVFSVSYGEAGWIGLLIVDPQSRGRGIGAALMNRAVGYLHGMGVETVFLEAAEKAVPLYKRSGFTEEFDSLRFSRSLGQREGRETLKHSDEFEIFPVEETDLKGLAAFDSKYFGVNRLRVLRSLRRDEPECCFLAREGRKLAGYILGRKTLSGYWLGPWVSKDVLVAEGLIRACVTAIAVEGAEVRLGMPRLNLDGVSLAKKLGFQLTGKSIRMIWGEPDHIGDVAGIYGVGGPEKG